MKWSIQTILCLVVGGGVLAGCMTTSKPRKPAPVVIAKPGSPASSGALGASRKAKPGEVYVVKKGDTLSLIAASRQLSVGQLASLNGLTPPYRIFIGQRLRVSDTDNSPGEVQITPYQSPEVTTAPVSSAPEIGSAPLPRTPSTTVSNSDTKSASSSGNGQMPVETVKKDNTKNVTNWLWPVKGMVLKKFGNGSKGIDISGQAGQAVLAAADGVVVYSGDKLRGYGNMIIIKHNDEFLSAYAHNSQLRAKENDRVKAGAHIADMGVNESGSPALHFEIRYKGKPVDPLRYLQ